MNARDYVGGNHFKASEIEAPINATISNVTLETLDGVQKMVLQFVELVQSVVLNKTNSVCLIGAYGEDTDRWIGKPVQITQEPVNFKGRVVPGLRLRVPPKATRGTKKPPQSVEVPEADEDLRF